MPTSVAMYEAKRSGRARAVMFDDAMRARLTRYVAIDTNLRKAIGTPEFSLAYQPIFDLHSGRLTSVEAPARWNHPELGQGPAPSSFRWRRNPASLPRWALGAE